MGSPISPLIANLFMEVKTNSSAPTPRLWLKYMDDTFVIQQAQHKSLVPPAYQLPGPTHPYLSWIPLSPWDPTTPSQHHYIENLPTEMNTLTGAVTITFQLNTVYTIL